MLLAGSIKAFAFGATIAAAVGPIALLIVGWGARAGFRPAACAGLGAAAADLTYALVAFLAGHLVLPALAAHATWVHLGASAVLLAIGTFLLRHAIHAPDRPAQIGRGARPFASTYVLTIVNPLTVVAFAGFAAQLPLAASALYAVWFSVCLFLGSLLVQTAFAVGGAAAGRLRWARALGFASAIGVMAFGVAGLVQGNL